MFVTIYLSANLVVQVLISAPDITTVLNRVNAPDSNCSHWCFIAYF